MNENGKASIMVFSVDICLLLSLLLVTPYYEANGGVFPTDNITVVQTSEIVFWCLFIAFIALSLWVISHIISLVCCYAVYFVQRAWYLHKLRKPERIYTGDPL